MDTDKISESKNIENDQEIKVEVKTESPENAVTSPEVPPTQKPSNNGNNVEKNGQKRVNSDVDDKTSKKPRLDTPEASSITNTNKVASGDIDNMSDTEEYYLTVANLPSDWTYVQIKNYLDEECGHLDELEMLQQKNSKIAIRLTFQSSEKRDEVYKKLKDKAIQDKKIEVEMTDVEILTPPCLNDGPPGTTEVVPLGPWKPDEDVYSTDPQGLYGLRPQYLTKLNIKPPLSSMVHVTNFRCDKSELREVMELAGNVLMCSVAVNIQKHAKVLYSHPLEAVQAISMLNGQKYYGSPLKITLDNNAYADTIILPKGLAGVGIGLGLEGRPLRNVAQQYQRYATKKSSSINPVVFSKITDNNTIESDEDIEEVQRKIKDFVTSFKVKNVDDLNNAETNSKDGSNRSTPDKNVTKAGSKISSIASVSPKQDSLIQNSANKTNNNSVKPLLLQIPNAITPLVRLSTPKARPTLLNRPSVPMNKPVPTPGHPNYGPVPTNFGNQPRPGPFGPRPGPFGPLPRMPFGPQPTPAPFGPPLGPRHPMPTPNFNGPRPFMGPNPAVPRPSLNPGNRVTVNFSNLPPSTTFPLLCEQLASCGQVMSVQLTTPGCAVATFGHPSHAERCYQNFNKRMVEGYVIEAKFA